MTFINLWQLFSSILVPFMQNLWFCQSCCGFGKICCSLFVCLFSLNLVSICQNVSGKKLMLHQSEMIYFTCEILKYSLKCSTQTFQIGIFKLLIMQKMYIFLLKCSSVMTSENWSSVCVCGTTIKLLIKYLFFIK